MDQTDQEQVTDANIGASADEISVISDLRPLSFVSNPEVMDDNMFYVSTEVRTAADHEVTEDKPIAISTELCPLASNSNAGVMDEIISDVSTEHRSASDEESLLEGESIDDPICLPPCSPTEKNCIALHDKLRGILSKLPHKKYQKCLDEVKLLSIDSVAKLRGVTDLIFEKALEEPKLAKACSELCVVLNEIYVPDNEKRHSADAPRPTAVLRAIILLKCQQLFKKALEAEIYSESQLKKLENETDGEMKKEMWEEYRIKAKLKSVNHVRFVSQLYHKKMIPDVVMIKCLYFLLNINTEESLQTLCDVLHLNGKSLEKPKDNTTIKVAKKGSDELERLFIKLQEMLKYGSFPAVDVKSMVENVVELKGNQWMPSLKRPENLPNSDAPKDESNAPREQNVCENILLPQHSLSDVMPVGDGVSNKRKQYDLDFILKLRSSPDSLKWPENLPNMEGKKKMRENIFLTQNNIDGLMSSNIPKGRKVYSRDFMMRLKASPYSIKRPITLPNLEALKGVPNRGPGGREDTKQNRQNIDSLLPSYTTDKGPQMLRTLREEAKPKTRKLSSSDLLVRYDSKYSSLQTRNNLKLAHVLVGKCINDLEFEEASKYFAERFKRDQDKELLVYLILVYGLDLSTVEKQKVGRLLADFILNGNLSRTHFVNGLKEFLDHAADFIVRYPKLWENLAVEIVNVVKDGVGFTTILNAFETSTIKMRLGSEPLETLLTTLSDLQPQPSQLKNKAKSNTSQFLNQDEVKLHYCATPWKPTRNNNPSTADEEKKTEALYRKVRGVLNKMTPENCETLVNQVKALTIENVAQLRGVADLVYEKAVQEPRYSVGYAKMCEVLKDISVPDDADNYRAILLYRCQQEFEKDAAAELNSDTRLKGIEDEPDPKKKMKLRLIFEEDQRRVRIKAFSNVRFVGELFKSKIINGMAMMICVEHLLKLNNEESLERLCKLLTSTGKLLEETVNLWKSHARRVAIAAQEEGKSDKSPEDAAKEVKGVDEYFNGLQELVGSKDKRLSNRVTFMIQDLIDLRNNQWVPRREDTNHETMTLKWDQMGAMAQSLSKPKGQLESHGKKDSSDNLRNAGSTSVQTSNRHNKLCTELSKLRLNTYGTVLGDEVNLGSRNRYNWGMGGKPADRNQPQQPPIYGMNKFTALLEDKPISRSSGLKGTTSQVFGLSFGKPRGYQTSAQGDSGNARNCQLWFLANSSGPFPAPMESVPLSAEENSRLTQNLLEEYLNILNFDDATKDLTEKFKSDGDKELFVYHMIIIGIDRNTKARRGAGRLLTDFLMTNSLSRSHFLNGLKNFLELAEDLVPDAPKLWEYLAEETVDVVTEGLGFAPILDAFKAAGDILGVEGPRKTLATLLRLIHTEKPNAPILLSAVPLVSEFVGEQDWEKCVQKNNLQFLDSLSVEPVAFDSAKTGDELIRLFRKKVSFNQIIQWITCNVGKAVTEPAFIFALTTAVLDVSGNRKWDQVKLDLSTLKNNSQLLIRFIDNDEARELHALYAVQAKVTEWQHPRGVLSEICHHWHQEAVISKDAFNKWKDTDNPQYAEGKGVCMASLGSFFVVLKRISPLEFTAKIAPMTKTGTKSYFL